MAILGTLLEDRGVPISVSPERSLVSGDCNCSQRQAVSNAAGRAPDSSADAGLLVDVQLVSRLLMHQCRKSPMLGGHCMHASASKLGEPAAAGCSAALRASVILQHALREYFVNIPENVGHALGRKLFRAQGATTLALSCSSSKVDGGACPAFGAMHSNGMVSCCSPATPE